jgi:hypothetical protein
MILRKPIVALALGVLVSTAVFTPNALAHERVVTSHHFRHTNNFNEEFRGSSRRTTPRTSRAKTPIPDVILTNNTTLTDTTILPAGTVLLAQTVLPAGTRLSNGTTLLTSVTLQSPVKLQHAIAVPAGTQLQANTALPVGTVLPSTPSLSLL